MDETITQLRDEIAALRAEIDQLKAAANASAHDQRPTTAATRRTGATARRSRRTILTAAAATGVALAAGRPAAATPVDPGAANGDALSIGRVNECTDTTELKFPAQMPGAPFNHVFVAQDGAWSTPRSPATSANRAAIAAFSGNWASHGMWAQTNAGTTQATGGTFVGILGTSYGLRASGGRAAMRISRLAIPGTQQLPPTERFDEHSYGEFLVDDNDDVWVCVADGRPGTWRKIAGRDTAGSFHPIEPARVYDSRAAERLGPGAERVVSVANATSGPEVVPSGATAIAYNLTVTAPTGPNFLAVVPADANQYTASTINFAGGYDIANGTVVRLDDNRQVRVFCGGDSGSTHFIIDVTGYYL